MAEKMGEIVEKGAIIAYDLPSENRVEVKDKKVYNRIRTTRILSTIKLHRLGILTTESVILIPNSTKQKISETVNEVYKLYQALNEDLEKNYNMNIGEPLIKVIPLTQKQQTDFKELAERKIKERLDKTIERLTELLNELETIIEENKKKKIRNNLRKQRKELERIEQFVKS